MRTKAILLALIATMIISVVSAQFKTRIYNLHFGIPINMKINYNSKLSTGNEKYFGGNVCIGNEHINSIIEYNWHSVDVSKTYQTPIKKFNIHELILGLRYYPARPTFILGKAGIRLTGGGSIGADLDLIGRRQYFFGFAVTGIREPSGVMIQLVHNRISKPTNGYEINPYWSVRISFVIGPTGQSS